MACTVLIVLVLTTRPSVTCLACGTGQFCMLWLSTAQHCLGVGLDSSVSNTCYCRCAWQSHCWLVEGCSMPPTAWCLDGTSKLCVFNGCPFIQNWPVLFWSVVFFSLTLQETWPSQQASVANTFARTAMPHTSQGFPECPVALCTLTTPLPLYTLRE